MNLRTFPSRFLRRLRTWGAAPLGATRAWREAEHRPGYARRLAQAEVAIPEGTFTDLPGILRRQVGGGMLPFWLKALPGKTEHATAVLGALTKAVTGGHWGDAEQALIWNQGEAASSLTVGTLSQWGGVEGMAGADEKKRLRLLQLAPASDGNLRHAFGHAMGSLFPFSAEALENLAEWGYPVAKLSLAEKWWETWLAHPVLHDLDADSVAPPGRRTVQAARAAAATLTGLGLPARGVNETGQPWLHVLVSSAHPDGTPQSLAALDGWVMWWMGQGADVRECDRDGNNVLHACCATGHALLLPRRLLSFFMESAPDLIAARNGVGQTPMDVFRATWREHGGLRRTDRDAWQARGRWLEAHQTAAGLHDTMPASAPAPQRARL